MRQAEDGAQERMLRLLTLAGQMGGETEHFEAASLEKGIEQVFVREGGQLAMVILGSVEEAWKFSRLRSSPWMRAVRFASQQTQVEIRPPPPLANCRIRVCWNACWRAVCRRCMLPLRAETSGGSRLGVRTGAAMGACRAALFPAINSQNIALTVHDRLLRLLLPGRSSGHCPGLVASVTAQLFDRL